MLGQTLSPVIYLSKAFAMSSLSINAKNRNQFQKHENRAFNIFYHLQMVILLTVLVCCVIYRQIAKTIYNSTGVITVSVQFAYYNCTIPIVALCLIATNANFRYIEDFLNGFQAINSSFRKFNCPVDYGRMKRVTQLMCCWFFGKVFLQNVPYLVTGFRHGFTDVLDYVIFNVPSILMYILTLQWTVYLNLLRIHFLTLNKLIKSLKVSRCWVVNDYFTVYNKNATNGGIVEVIRRTGLIYDSLCIQGDRLNRAFAWQILFIVPALFIMIIYNSFNVCQMIKDKEEFNGSVIVFDVMYFVTFLELILPCVFAKEVADQFVENLHRIDVIFDRNADLEEIVNSLTLQTYHQKLEFSTFGVFPLDGTLIYSIFGALTTYLVILLQFDV